MKQRALSQDGEGQISDARHSYYSVLLARLSPDATHKNAVS